ncbi:hypothetical protein HY450_00405 [Candidatus Pacearchaeota archaeon]|nr:hypothetical protein [Candidatus Pacearchaeota archaeon]
MLSITKEELDKFDFEILDDLQNIRWRERAGTTIIAKSDDSGVYSLVRARDVKGNFYSDPKRRMSDKAKGDRDINEILTYVSTIEDLLDELSDPRWHGVGRETKDILFRIARTPPTERTKELENSAWEMIHDGRYDNETKEWLELAYDGATLAHVTGKPEKFTKYNPNAVFGRAESNQL